MKENNIEKDIKVLKDLKNKWELNAFGDMVNVLSLNEIKALEHILSDYKKLQEDFEQIDNECNRLEKIDFEKDMKIKELQKENEKLKNNTRKNENELEVGIDCNWDALQKVLDEAEKTNEYIIYDNEKWIKEKYCIPVQKIKDRIEKLQKTNFNDYTKEQDGNEVKTKILYEFKKLLEGEE